MMTFAPLPTWKTIFKSGFKKPSPDELLSAKWCREGEVAGWLSRSAWSLALIAEWRRQNITHKNDCIVWVPDFFCNASLMPIRKLGVKLVFYPITKEMTPDIVKVKELAQHVTSDIFILVHYFGKPAGIKHISDFCRSQNSWLVEDAAHVLKPIKGIGEIGDFVIYSPHKHLPIPDGAILVARPNGPSLFGTQMNTITGMPQNWASSLNFLKQMFGDGYVRNSKNESWVWFCKRVIQKCGYNKVKNTVIPFDAFIDGSNQKIIEPQQSQLSKKILSIIVDNLNQIALHKHRNQLLLDEIITSNFSDIKVAERPFQQEWVPYLSAYEIANKQIGKSRYDYFAGLKLPVSIWPDLPPEVISNYEHFNGSWSLRHDRLYFSIHQSLYGKEILRVFRKKEMNIETPPIQVQWDTVSSSTWEDLITRTGKSNLLQGWAYGESKKLHESWKVKRGVFYLDQEPVAIVQVLQKFFFGIAKITRINRGPLFLKELTVGEKKEVFQMLSKFGDYTKASVLSIAPELLLSGANLLMMESLGFRQASNLTWKSIWIDLSIELQVLRKKLDGKWRNMLNFSEKSELTLEYGNNEDLFKWMINHYKGLMKEKKFSGLSAEFIRDYKSLMIGTEKLIIFRASKDNDYVAGICIVCHGNSATYLLGWNGAHGRLLKANQFLLWNAIEYLKNSGTLFFDLGGVNEEDVPGITTFKTGLNGTFYELTGEYLKW